MVAQTRPATLADLDVTPDDGRIYELLDGEIIVSPAPTPRHQDTLQALNRLLDRWVMERDLGTVMFAPTDVVLDEKNALQPDLFYYSIDNPLHEVNGRLHGAPDLAVEVMSPSSRDRDAVVKAMRYALAGVREFWLVDPAPRTITIFVLHGDSYDEAGHQPDGSLPSDVLPGLSVDRTAIFRQVDRAAMLRRKRR